MSTADTRPRWMLAKQARISQRRLARFDVKPSKIDPAAWWEQIGVAAAELGLERGEWSDWHVGQVAAIDNSEPL